MNNDLSPGVYVFIHVSTVSAARPISKVIHHHSMLYNFINFSMKFQTRILRILYLRKIYETKKISTFLSCKIERLLNFIDFKRSEQITALQCVTRRVIKGVISELKVMENAFNFLLFFH